MKVEILSSFERDIENIFDISLKEKILVLIDKLESANSLKEVPGVKKLKGFWNAYRIKLGNYRIGLYFDKGTIELARFINRKDIYRVFP